MRRFSILYYAAAFSLGVNKCNRPRYTNTFLCYLPTFIYSYVCILYIQLELIPLQTTTNTPRRSMNGCVFILFIFLFTIIYTSSFNSSLFQKQRANSRSECIRCSTEHLYIQYRHKCAATNSCVYLSIIYSIRVRVYTLECAQDDHEKRRTSMGAASEKL